MNAQTATRGKVYIASMNLRGKWATKLDPESMTLNVTSAQGKLNQDRLAFSPMTAIPGGYKGYDRMGWTGYYVRAGTNPAIVDQLAQAINNLNAGPEWSQKRDLVWSEWKNLKPAELLVRIRHETETYTRLIQKIGFYAD